VSSTSNWGILVSDRLGDLVAAGISEAIDRYLQDLQYTAPEQWVMRVDELRVRATTNALDAVALWWTQSTGLGERGTVTEPPAVRRLPAQQPHPHGGGPRNRQNRSGGVCEDALTAQLPVLDPGRRWAPAGERVKCQACGRMIPKTAGWPFHPDGAPEVVDWVCQDIEDCRREQVARAQIDSR
jgi:hypothetical protein